jgi:UDP-N-acetylmuramoylalanine--D-glutamate ligase
MTKRVVILGGAESGLGAAKLARRQGYDVFLSDAGTLTGDRKAWLTRETIPFEEGGHTEGLILNADVVVKSPGIPSNAPIILALLSAGVEIISEIEFGYRHLPAGAKVLAITGTNGKTTTTLLAHHLLKSAGLKVALGGNVGTSLAGLVAEGGYDYYVVEVSSFQLDDIVEFKPDVAVLLNITPDHMDRYGYKMENYVASKFRVTENQFAADTFIYCHDSKPVLDQVERGAVKARSFAVSTESQMNKGGWLLDGKLHFKTNGHQYEIPVGELPLIGKHNMVNTMAAVLTGLSVGVPFEQIRSALKTFVNAPHRLELVGEQEGIRFINDSKATNVDSVYYALDGIPTKIVWIAGGIDKGNEYGQIEGLVRQKVKALVCLGKKNTPLLDFFGGVVPRIVETTDVKEAVRLGRDFASSGDTVLLSPACASFDLFKNYEDRGDQFRAAVKELTGQPNVSA